MCHYCHLTSKERFIASALFCRGYSFIAKLFSRSKSPIFREFWRNYNPRIHCYDSQAAHRKYEYRRKNPVILKSYAPIQYCSLKLKTSF